MVGGRDQERGGASALLPQRPASQEERQGEGGEGNHGSLDKQGQPESNPARMVNPPALVSVRALVPVHVPASFWRVWTRGIDQMPCLLRSLLS
jgi:hypothetical protein